MGGMRVRSRQGEVQVMGRLLGKPRQGLNVPPGSVPPASGKGRERGLKRAGAAVEPRCRRALVPL